MGKLKPCPFCGGEAEVLFKSQTTPFGEESFAVAFCTSCEISTPRYYYYPEQTERDTPEMKAAKHWNTRVENG